MAEQSISADRRELLRVEDLKMYFPAGRGKVVRAVDSVSFVVHRGETLGLVGESGSGKSTVARAVLHLYKPTGGKVIFDGKDLATMSPGEMQAMRRRMQIIFQDPFASLNPRMTAGTLVAEGLRIHKIGTKQEREAEAARLLDLVGVGRAFAPAYPHEFSGGQQQRIGIARALALKPDLLICDEPVSSLDVSIQAQIINLLVDLQKDLGLAYLFIAHNLAVVEQISHRVAVMYLGVLVELAPTAELYNHPQHPYTQALLSAVPRFDGANAQRIPLTGEIPSPINPPTGCRFHTRCPRVMERCKKETPPFKEQRPGHWVACHLYD